jgi:N-acylneuraminate cytidylyltransferase
MKNLAIITARGGSKRIPKKNIKSFLGYPIIKYSINAAIDSGCFDEVMVSTDDIEIAEIAKKYGASVPFVRSVKTSDDFATTVDVITEVIEMYGQQGIIFDNFCCIYPTAPFITQQKLRTAIDLLISSGCLSVLPVTQYSFPILRSLKIEDERIHFNWPEFANTRSQDIKPAYHDCGQFYVMGVSAFLKKKAIITENTIPIIVPESEVQDIDNEEDWRLAEIKYTFLKEKGLV